MPYSIEERDNQYCVCGDDGQPVDGGCHGTKADAEAHMRALYANVEDAHYARVRLNLISEVALASDGAARPLHILRTGTFTSGGGFTHTFTADDIGAIVTNFAAGKRKRPPITERHDWGRAVGRIERVWADAAGENLYAQPKWNKEGARLLADEVYDGFSCELDGIGAAPFLVGGSLTNYPAVDGLEPVTLSAPPIEEQQALALPTLPLAAGGLRLDSPPTTQETARMSDPTPTPALERADVPPLPPISDPALQARVDAYFAQQQAAMQQREREIEARLKADFERRMLETDQRNAIHQYARQRTITTTEQPYAVPCTAEELAQLLLETPAGPRAKWQALLTRVTTSGLATFDEIGSSAEGAEVADRWSILVNAKVAAGLSKVQAIQAVAREYPDLYDQQTRSKKGGR